MWISIVSDSAIWLCKFRAKICLFLRHFLAIRPCKGNGCDHDLWIWCAQYRNACPGKWWQIWASRDFILSQLWWAENRGGVLAVLENLVWSCNRQREANMHKFEGHHFVLPFAPYFQRKTKGQQLKGKIVSALFHTSSHFSTYFHTFSPRAFYKK